jgi:two-component system chemotaxis response regulator CheV
METNILLENGTNELEVLEFTLGDNHYGINVAKVREILSFQPVTPIPNSHPSVEGVFMPRDLMLTVINLKNCIGVEQNSEEGLFIITNFNKLNVAFHVDEVLGIHRLSWTDITTPDATINAPGAGVATGITKIDEKLVVILDFEKIVSDINPETGLKVSDIDSLKRDANQRNDSPILIAEDSALLSKLIAESLKKAGYTNLTVTKNGQEAWEHLLEIKENGKIGVDVKCVITDIEMPIMDGHRLLKLIKEDPDLGKVPVVIFSSLVNDEMRRKGEQLGADAQLSKPEIGSLVSEIDKLLF